jgi:hypothetical protein
MTACDEIPLGLSGIEFVRARLGWNRALARAVSAYHDLDAARVVTHLPAGTLNTRGMERVLRFSESILLEQPPRVQTPARGGGTAWVQEVPSLDPLLTTIIASWLSASTNRAVVFEEALLDASGVRQSAPETRYVTHDDEAYYLLTRSQIEIPAIETALREATWLHGLGFFTSLPEGVDVPVTGACVTVDLLNSLAQRTKQLVLDAYDAEGFVLCNLGAHCVQS